MPFDVDQSWEAWRIALLQRLDSLERQQELLNSQLLMLNNMLIETVGVSGNNGRIGTLEKRMDDLEKRGNQKMLVGGAVGGGFLAGLVEGIRAIFS